MAQATATNSATSLVANLDTGKNTAAAGKPLNEDYVEIANLPEGLAALVADGISGGQVGEFMSEQAVKAVCASLRESSSVSPLEQLEQAFQFAHASILAMKQQPRFARSGTTLICALLVEDSDGVMVHIGNIGDTRAYLLQSDRTLHQISHDHSTAERLTYALGFEMDVQAVPDFYSCIPLRAGETLLLCSDGVYKFVPQLEIISILSKNTTQKAADRLVQAAIARGTNDNTSVITIRTKVRSQPALHWLPLTIGMGLVLCLIGLALLFGGNITRFFSSENPLSSTPELNRLDNSTMTILPVQLVSTSTTLLAPFTASSIASTPATLAPTVTRAPTLTPTSTPTPTFTPTRTPTRTPRPTRPPATPTVLAPTSVDVPPTSVTSSTSAPVPPEVVPTGEITLPASGPTPVPATPAS